MGGPWPPVLKSHNPWTKGYLRNHSVPQIGLSLGRTAGVTAGRQQWVEGSGWWLSAFKQVRRVQTSWQGTGPQACLHQVWATRLGRLLPSQATFGEHWEWLQLETLFWDVEYDAFRVPQSKKQFPCTGPNLKLVHSRTSSSSAWD